jgi:hypothetical protein
VKGFFVVLSSKTPFLDLAGRHLDILFGQRKDLSHPHADKLTVRSVLACAGFEVTLDLLQFV